MSKRIAVVTGCNKTYEPLLDISLPVKQDYCKQHGYDLIIDNNRFNKTHYRHAWEKLPVILSQLETYEWVFWSDVDSLIMNTHINLIDLIDDNKIIIASLLQFDRYDPHIHFGNILVNNSKLTKQILKVTYSYKSKWNVDPKEEEGAFFHMVWKKTPILTTMIKRMKWSTFFSLPQCFPNISDTIQLQKYTWKPGMFVVHMTKPLSLQERITYMEQYRSIV